MPTAAKITDLLPIPDGTTKPHAYQVFGLEGGEQDPRKIAAAVEATVQRLNAAKSDTDAKLWSQAAKAVKQARAILADPNKKSALDARFGIVHIEDVPPPPPATAPDPLAGVLPSADPLASVLPAANPLAPAAPAAPLPPTPAPVEAPSATQNAAPTNPAVTSPQPIGTLPPGMFGTPEQVEDAGQIQSPVLVKKATTSGRRRRRSFGGLMFATFAIGMFAIIGGLGYFLFFGTGELAITSKDGQLTITTKPTEGGGETTKNVGDQRPVDTRPVDPIMGRLAGDGSKPGSISLENDLSNGVPAATASSPDEPPPGPMKSDPDPNMVAMSEVKPTVDPELPPDSTVLPVDPAMAAGPAETEMTEEMVAAGEAMLQKIRSAIRDAKWNEMKVAAEQATEATLTDEQREQAESLFQVADLASFYRGGIERGIGGLVVGNDFDANGIRLIVVEVGQDLLAIRANAKTRSYTFDELPFFIAHAVARFSLSPDDPTNVAAKAAYQAIAPKSTDAHRDEAYGWLESLGSEVEGAEPKRVVETIKALYAESPEA